MLCYCVEEVDLEVFRGVFVQQWLRGHAYRGSDPMYFCTTCGPPAVAAALREADKKLGKPGASKSVSTPTNGKDKVKFSLSKLFGRGVSASKKDLTNAGATGNASGAGGATTPVSASTYSGNHSHSRTHTGGTNSSFGGAGGGFTAAAASGAPTPHSQTPSHGRVFSAEEEERPPTPRTEEELFLCATCGACYCKNHASDHHYSRRRPDETNWAGGGPAVNLDERNPLQGYPHHSMFIGVPSFISTHPAHVMEETPWGLLFPTVLMRDIESGALDLSKEYTYFDNPEVVLDELMIQDANPSLTAHAGVVRRSGRSTLSRSTAANEGGSAASGAQSGERTPDTGLQIVTSSPQRNGETTTLVSHRYENSPPSRALSSNPTLPSQGLVYVSQGGERWSYMCWCARCGSRPVRLQAKHYDDGNSRQRRLRQLGQSLAILSYLCRRGVRLELPARYVTWKANDDAAVRRRQQQQQQTMLAMEQRVGKATEGVEFTASANAAARAGEGSAAITTAYTTEAVDLTRSETDRVLTRACLCGFSNPSYLCYLNSVLQCVLRCAFFTRPLMSLPSNAYPGKLSKSLGLLLHHLEQETYQDVRNDAVYPFVKSVYRQICHVSSLFELDEQQDAQELLITLLNGVADEFDKGKTAEEKARLPRISFEGSLRSEVVCSRCHQRVPRDEMFMSLSIPIKGSIEQGLRGVFAPAYLKGKDRYACERCFQRMSAEQQEAHNAQAREQTEERRKLREAGKRVPPTSEDPAKFKTENCLYQEAEVRTSLTRLGGTLAIHLLRFHYDADRQDFVKVASPVSIPLTLDLSPYVSTEVLERYSAARALRTLQARFPAVPEPILQDYLDKAAGDQGAATKQLLSDGHGVEDNLESSIQGEPPLVPTEAVTAGQKGVAGATSTSTKKAAAAAAPYTCAGTAGKRPAAKSAADNKVSAKKSSGAASNKGGNIAGEPPAFANDEDDDADVRSVGYSAVTDGAAAGRVGTGEGARPTGHGSLNSPPDVTGTAPSSLGAGSTAAGAARARQPLLSPGAPSYLPSLGDNSVLVESPTSPNPPAPTTLTPQQILKLKTADFDPFGDRSCPVAGGGPGEKRATGGGKGLGRVPSLTRQLVGIVTHRGSLHGGHYIAYVRHLGRPEVWFRCDDEDVDVVPEKTVLACASEVYLAFYE